MRKAFEIVVALGLVAVELVVIATLVAPRAVARRVRRVVESVKLGLVAIWSAVRRALDDRFPRFRPPRPA